MEKREIKISFGTFVFIVIIIALLVAIVVVDLYIMNKNSQENEQIAQNVNSNKNEVNGPNIVTNEISTTIPTVEPTELYLDSTQVKELYNYVTGPGTTMDMMNYNPISFYRTEKLTNTTIEDDFKMYMILCRMLERGAYDIKYQGEEVENLYELPNIEITNAWNKETGEYDKKEQYYATSIGEFNMQDIQEEAMKIFNTNVAIRGHSYDLAGIVFAYEDNKYKYVTYEGGGGVTYLDDNRLIKAVEDLDKIYLYDNYVRVEGNLGETIIIYADSEEKLKLGEIAESSLDYPTEYIEEQLGIKLPLYKHTFKQREDGGYYWVSSELINKDELKIIE